jgi:hypothetical protein
VKIPHEKTNYCKEPSSFHQRKNKGKTGDNTCIGNILFLNKRNIDEFQVVENTFYIISELFLTQGLLATIKVTQVE